MPTVGTAAGNLRIASVTLTDAQIKALPVTPIQVVAPTETNNYVGNPRTLQWAMFAYFALNADAGAYTNVAAGGTRLGIYLDQFADIDLTSLDASGSFAAGGNSQWFAGPTLQPSGTVLLSRLVAVSDGGIHDNGLYVAAPNNGQGAFTAGNAANTLSVSVGYMVLPSGLA